MQSTEQKLRGAFEEWAREQFYSGLACPSDTWSDERKTYSDAAHHMAFCAFRAALSAGDAVDAQRYRWLMQFETWPEEVETAIDLSSKPMVDAAIDAAMRKGQL